jgi:SAM-dependent methyltransferase
MRLTDRIMENTHAYRLWQAPFQADKFAPILLHNDLSPVRRVLDVGCGPGINTEYFRAVDYLGIDWNPEYIDFARKRHRRTFVVADVTTYTVEHTEKFDFILVNSFFHHIDLKSVQRVLRHLATLLTPDGHIHIVDLVLPLEPGIASLLARMDRGKFVRPIDHLSALVREVYEPVLIEPFDVGMLGATLWKFAYFKGRVKS